VLGDILPFWLHWLSALVALFVYFMLTFFLAVPGCGEGYLGPGMVILSSALRPLFKRGSKVESVTMASTIIALVVRPVILTLRSSQRITSSKIQPAKVHQLCLPLIIEEEFTRSSSLDLYKTGPFDPEGLLGNLTSIFMVSASFQLPSPDLAAFPS